jgi:hypothetical protein
MPGRAGTGGCCAVTTAGTRPDSGRVTGWKAVIVWVGVPIDIALLIGAYIPVAMIPGLGGSALLAIAFLAVAVGAFGVVGSLVATRLPRNPIGWILWATATVIAGSIAGNSYAQYSIETHSGTLPGTIPLAVLSQADLLPLVAAMTVFLPLFFPNGHLPSPRWRGVARFSALAVAFGSVLSAVMPGPLSGGTTISNPLGIAALADAGAIPSLLVLLSLGVPFVLAVASVVWRYRRAGEIERRQVKWFAGAVVALVVCVLLSLSNIGPLQESGWLVMMAGFALAPVAIGMAILRYRLYEIDRIISRTISYAVVTGVLLLVVAGAILASQAILSRQIGGNAVVVAASTLMVAGLFQPLRRRVQSVVDRRFDRSRYDAQVAAEAFGVRLRDQVDLGRIEQDLATTIDGSLRPLSVGLWVRDVTPGTGA